MRQPTRRLFALTAAVLLVAGCAIPSSDDPQIVKTLAPSGVLKVGVYRGSPSSLVVDAKTGELVGVAKHLGEALAARLNVPVQIVEFERLALVLEALKVSAVDFTFTNATPVRARDVDFTLPLIQLELGYLVPPDSHILTIGDVDQSGVRIGVAQGSSSQAALGHKATGLQTASLVPAASIPAAQAMLREKKMDAFASNKAILFEMATHLPSYRVLDGRWGLENLAIAVPKGREAAAQYLRRFADDVRADGRLKAIILKSGMKGTAA